MSPENENPGMPSETFDDLKRVLTEMNIFPSLFDLSRIVDAESGKVVELRQGVPCETKVSCNDIFGAEARCRNCTSIRAHYSKETVVKLEYANESVLFILSVPVQLRGRHLVVELAKDITRSMVVDVKDQGVFDEIPSIIDRLNKVATTDSLTSLHNRRYLDEKLPQVLASCQRMELPVTLAMIDLDHFKRVNDDFGHQCGDHILRGVGLILNSYIRRGSDFAVRYGGEEMLICFPGVSLADGVAICTRLHQQIQSTIFEFEGRRLGITASLGLASSTPSRPLAAEAFIALADRHLYQAKAEGRNRISYPMDEGD